MIGSLKGLTKAMKALEEAIPSTDEDMKEIWSVFLRGSETYDAAHEALANGDRGEFDRLRKEAEDLAQHHKVLAATFKAKLTTIH